MLQGEHSAILLTFIKLPFVIKIFVLSMFEWSLKTGFTVYPNSCYNKVPTSSGNHGKPGKSRKKKSMHGKIMEFEKT